MAVQSRELNPIMRSLRAVVIILEMIKFEHTLFALPFALISMLLAERSIGKTVPTLHTLVWILGAMLGARSAAMSFNRIVDASIDGRNPRTRARAIPSGLVNSLQAGLFTLGALALLEISAWELNPLCLALSPIAVLVILGYSYSKRFTAWSHLVLGVGIGLAPVGAWTAVTGRIQPPALILWLMVTLWIGGFDIIYATQDEDFDRNCGLHSIPARFGRARALLAARAAHITIVPLMIWLGLATGLHLPYAAGALFVTGLLAYEHSIVSADDISRVNVAFFTLNGWISAGLLVSVAADTLLYAR